MASSNARWLVQGQPGLPVDADVPKFLCKLGWAPEAYVLDAAVGDLTVMHSTTSFGLVSTPAR